ncbi:MAG: type II secretion system protein J [Synechocystis sp.]
MQYFSIRKNRLSIRNKIFKCLRPLKKQSGFTLLELLMASMMTFFVVSATGWGLLVMLREQTATSTSSEVAQNTNRAMDFITEEMKTASSVLDATELTAAGGSCNGSAYTPILGITVAGLSAPIIYCINTNANTAATNTAWLGKYVVYRWGPSFGSDGSYGTGAYTLRPFIDLVAETPETSTCQNAGWTQIPSSSPKGFFVCVNPAKNMAEVNLATSALDARDNSAQTWASDKNSRLGNRASYQANSTVFTRAPSDVVVTVTPTSSPGGGTRTFRFNRLAGDTSIGFTISGSAVAGTNYNSPPTGSTGVTLTMPSGTVDFSGGNIRTLTFNTNPVTAPVAITVTTNSNQSATAAITPP